MPIKTHTRLNLVVDTKLQEILAYFRAKYPLLADPDLIKMAVSGFYTNEINNLPEIVLSQQQDRNLSDSLASKTANQPSFGKVENLVEYLDN
jgi:hypothetical protein